MKSWDLQVAVHSKLNGSAELAAKVTGIFDHVQQKQAYPYVVIGEDLSLSADTDTTLNSDHTLKIHVWSRQRGRKETKQIQQLIYGLLHHQALTIDGVDHTNTDIQDEETFLDDDGLTRHGIQRFNVLLDNEVI